MNRTKFRAFKCRLGIHRWYMPFSPFRTDLYKTEFCSDCKKPNLDKRSFVKRLYHSKLYGGREY